MYTHISIDFTKGAKHTCSDEEDTLPRGNDPQLC